MMEAILPMTDWSQNLFMPKDSVVASLVFHLQANSEPENGIKTKSTSVLLNT